MDSPTARRSPSQEQAFLIQAQKKAACRADNSTQSFLQRADAQKQPSTPGLVISLNCGVYDVGRTSNSAFLLEPTFVRCSL